MFTASASHVKAALSALRYGVGCILVVSGHSNDTRSNFSIENLFHA